MNQRSCNNACANSVDEDVKKAKERVRSTFDSIEQIRKIFHAPSIAIGVLHKNQIIAEHGFGICDQDSGRVPDSETVYSMGSCTKAFTATGLGILKQEGKCQWETPLRSLLPEFASKDPEVEEKANLHDALTHTTGLSSLAFAAVGKFSDIFLKADKVVSGCSVLAPVKLFRRSWHYNNWMYALASRIVSRATGDGWGTFTLKTILSPLGLSRTYFSFPQDDNYARAYVSLEDGSHEQCHLPMLEDGDAFDGAGCMRSCVKDMITWSKHLMVAANKAESNTFCTGAETKMTALREAMWEVQQPKFPIAGDEMQMYGYGLLVLNLPTSHLSGVSHTEFSSRDPVIGKHSPPRKAVGHDGAVGSFLTGYWTFPETDSAVIVLSNIGIANGNISGVVASTLIQALFNMQPHVDFEEVAKQNVSHARTEWYTTLIKWRMFRNPTGSTHALDDYVGDYYHEELGILLEITKQHGLSKYEEKPTELQMKVNNSKRYVFQLFNYHDDAWSFMPENQDDCLRQGYEIFIAEWLCFNLYFERFSNGKFRRVTWRMGSNGKHDDVTFTRR